MRKLIAASILSADFSRLGEEVKRAHKAGVDWIHFDVMDGCFVPNITLGVPVLESIRPVTGLTLDVHLMILDPSRYIRQFRDAGADLITVHVEACTDMMGCVRQIKESGAKAGVSLNPETPLDKVANILPELDLVLFMGVDPGFGGQKFREDILPKIAEARGMIDSKGLATLIEVDGGVNDKTAGAISKAGTDVFVAGSYLFKHPDGVAAAVAELRKRI